MASLPIDELRALAENVVGRANRQSEGGVGASFDVRVASTIDLIDHGEAGVGLENLAQNIFEFDVPVSRAEFLTIERAGTAFGLAPNAWTFLEPLIR